MIDLNYILDFYPYTLKHNERYKKHILKEYVELMALDYISHTPFAEKLAFIGGTNLRLTQGIDRFSEDLDFDCKGLSIDEFVELTDSVILFLRQNGLNAQSKDSDNSNLSAYRRNIIFPELLFDLNLTGHKEERFLMKVEAQDQGITYKTERAIVNRCGFVFPIPVPPNPVLLSMKLTALLKRGKGRDFYDVMFLWQKCEPDYLFLKARCGIQTPDALKNELHKVLETTDLNLKKKDFEHLLFTPHKCEQILLFNEFVNTKSNTYHITHFA